MLVRVVTTYRKVLNFHTQNLDILLKRVSCWVMNHISFPRWRKTPSVLTYITQTLHFLGGTHVDTTRHRYGYRCGIWLCTNGYRRRNEREESKERTCRRLQKGKTSIPLSPTSIPQLASFDFVFVAFNFVWHHLTSTSSSSSSSTSTTVSPSLFLCHLSLSLSLFYSRSAFWSAPLSLFYSLFIIFHLSILFFL